MGDNHSSDKSGKDNDPDDGDDNAMVMIMTTTSLNKEFFWVKEDSEAN